MKIALFVSCLVFLCCSGFTTRGWNTEYWQDFRWQQWKYKDFSLYGSGSFRFDHFSRNYRNQVTENLAYQLLPNLGIEAHYTYIYVRSPINARFVSQNRYELEFNPSITLKCGTQLNWRNRFEWIRIHGTPPIDRRFRHRFQIVVPLKHSGRLKELVMSNELFYDFVAGEFTQNRFIPAGLRLQLSKESSLLIYLMIRNFQDTGQWYKSVLLGSEFSF